MKRKKHELYTPPAGGEGGAPPSKIRITISNGVNGGGDGGREVKGEGLQRQAQPHQPKQPKQQVYQARGHIQSYQQKPPQYVQPQQHHQQNQKSNVVIQKQQQQGKGEVKKGGADGEPSFTILL